MRLDDESAFAELYHRYVRKLVNTALRKTGNQTTAEDLVHELFLKLWLNRHELRIQKTVAAYVQSALKKLVISHYYYQSVRSTLSLDAVTDNDLAPASSTPETLPEGFVRDLYERSLQKLPEKCREVFVMSRDGFTSREIAQNLQISEKTVEGHITKALRMLRLEMKDYTVVVLLLMTSF